MRFTPKSCVAERRARLARASFLGIQWVISAYVLAALLLAAGNFADLHSRRRAMLLGLALFAVLPAVPAHFACTFRRPCHVFEELPIQPHCVGDA